MNSKMIALLAACLNGAVVAEATQYSCLSIITETKKIGKWEALKGWINASGLSDEWSKCNYIADTYPQYGEITNALVCAGILTNGEIADVLSKSVDPAMPDTVLMALYHRDMTSASGRAKWHGRLIRSDEDVTNLVQTFTYEDGYTFSQPFTRAKPLTVKQRFELERRRRDAEARRELARLPPGLRKVKEQRTMNASTTNEVTQTFSPGREGH